MIVEKEIKQNTLPDKFIKEWGNQVLVIGKTITNKDETWFCIENPIKNGGYSSMIIENTNWEYKGYSWIKSENIIN